LAENPSERAIEEARRYIIGELSPTAKALRKQGFTTLAASSGTAQSIAALIAFSRASTYEKPIIPDRLNNFHCSYEEVRTAVKTIVTARTVNERKKLPGLDEKRADIILGGALILQESMRLVGAKEMVVSSYALREGIIYDFIHSRRAHLDRRHDKLRDVRITSVRHLAEHCGYDEKHADHIATLCDSMFVQLKSLHGLDDQAREYLRYAAILHDVGYHISHAEHHKHSYYIISNADLLGFTHEEIEVIANIARYHRKSHPKLKHDGFLRLQTDEHRALVRKLAAILRIAEGLDRGNIGIIRSVKCRLSPQKVVLHLTKKRGAGRDAELEIWGADRKKMLFQEVYAREVRFLEA
jgi:exopolyphosphatase/guanosine-5'-triphosphate,3'-diphosphate pyrophosphatase